MVLVAEAQQLKAKLMLNGRPEKMVRKKMLDGAGMIPRCRSVARMRRTSCTARPSTR